MADDAIRDLFARLGQIKIRKMFGGKGVYFDGPIVALEVGGELLLKADHVSAADFAAAGSQQWVYEGSARKTKASMPYWTVPSEAADDPDKFLIWARKAYEASLRSLK